MYSRDPQTVSIHQDAAFWCRRGADLMHKGDYTNSITFFDKAITIYPSLVDAIENKAKCLDELGHYSQAIDCYDKAIQIDPGNSDIWYNKSISYLKMGKVQEAEVCAKTALDLAMGI
jgi:tetratricopeptide (TPR) repeat protein